MTTNTKETAGPYLDLNDGHQIPQLGFGVFQVEPDETAEAVTRALDVGYRLIDTAAMYGNEAGVGEAINKSELDRGDVFVTTKLANDAHGHDEALRAFDHSLEELGFDYVDLYLIHWPIPKNDLYVDTWRALCELKESGRARSIGVSNFLVEHLETIIDATGEVPAVNQIEVHPQYQEQELRRYLREHEIVPEAYSPLGQGGALKDEKITEIAKAHDRTPAQVVLRWHIQLGNVVIPKSVTPSRIEENFRIFDFELSDSEMETIKELDAGQRIGPDPKTFG
ncbi:MAG TPA: aldo/keto reductase [Solirubrobacteraceae bacterium]|nr:aldo/keto reductase [Solirubrobacteraceae bacterium]